MNYKEVMVTLLIIPSVFLSHSFGYVLFSYNMERTLLVCLAAVLVSSRNTPPELD